MGLNRVALVMVVALAACDDSVGPGPILCVRDCVSEVSIDPSPAIVRPGDVIPFKASLTVIGTVKPGVRWSGTPGAVLTIDSAGVATITGLGLANVFARPVGDSTAFAYSVVWSVRGDTSVPPMWARGLTLLPASKDPAAIPDSIAMDLRFLIGTNAALPARVEIVATGPKDTVISVPVIGTPGVAQGVRVIVRHAPTASAPGLPKGAYQFHTRLVLGDGRVSELANSYLPSFIP